MRPDSTSYLGLQNILYMVSLPKLLLQKGKCLLVCGQSRLLPPDFQILSLFTYRIQDSLLGLLPAAHLFNSLQRTVFIHNDDGFDIQTRFRPGRRCG